MILPRLAALALVALLLGAAPTGAEGGRAGDPLIDANGDAPSLTVLFTGETRGNLLPCACPEEPWGGLARRVEFLRSRRSQAAGPVLALDSGGFLPVGEVPLRNDPEAERRLIALLVESLSLAGFDAVALDPTDRDYLRALVPDLFGDVDPICLENDAGALLFSWGHATVAVIALDESLEDGVLAARAAEARRRAQVLFVLARADAITGRRIAEKTDADLLLLSRGARPKAPLRWGRTWVLGPGKEGREVGEVRLARRQTGIAVEHFALVPMDDGVPVHAQTEARVRELLDEYGPGWRTLVRPLE